MSPEPSLICFAGWLVLASSAHAQGTFVNLDFENPILPLIADVNHMVPVDRAIPGWNAYVGYSEITSVLFNTETIDAPYVSFHGPESTRSPFEGNYCVLLKAGYDSGQLLYAAIAQSGQVPDSAQSMRFHANNLLARTVTFAGLDLPVFNLSGGFYGYQEYGVDISMFAGQTGELRFTGGSGLLDYIQFSPVPIPEPSVLGLLGLGAGVILTLRPRAQPCSGTWRFPFRLPPSRRPP